MKIPKKIPKIEAANTMLLASYMLKNKTIIAVPANFFSFQSFLPSFGWWL